MTTYIDEWFNYILENDPRVIAFGEDVGHVGDVNQGFAGLQNKFGTLQLPMTVLKPGSMLVSKATALSTVPQLLP